MAGIKFTPELYTEAVKLKQLHEEYIANLYAQYDNLIFSDKLVATQVIDQLKIVLFELEKYIIAYEQSAKKTKTKSDYLVLEGDTLPRVASLTLGSPQKWKEIYVYNELNDIYLEAGTLLKIPGA